MTKLLSLPNASNFVLCATSGLGFAVPSSLDAELTNRPHSNRTEVTRENSRSTCPSSGSLSTAKA